ncbi:uncharacterized protein zbbx isoform X1 [Hippocampus zosterae]|uniref:uncharacterized protein zbbx isoform X1 n=1 Tax=Hippocampus zosterae TaxID=109293 RepID=UPI00223CD93E|nr:uncharacterized protein zbbx isoform X1 [Hippocampus zosterae]XP_051934235.1 uncharacterized protein zbbx isoform X1 [Hippocampus zosterae]
MNFNDFVALPKTKSLQFSARNPQGQQLETVILAQQGNELEEKLQKLKENMRREKGERGQSGIFHWKSEQLTSINSSSMTQGTKKTQKQLSAGRVKIRVLKDEPVTAPPHLPLCETCCCPQTTTRQSKMKGSFRGQGDSRTDQQMFIRNYDEKTRVELTKKEHNKDAKNDFTKSLLGGEYDEEESARSFQEALKEWRNQRCDDAIEPVTIWTQTVSMSGKAAQTDFPPERGHEGEGSSVPVQVQFPERSLSYMDRLLLKKYRSTNPLTRYLKTVTVLCTSL